MLYFHTLIWFADISSGFRNTALGTKNRTNIATAYFKSLSTH